MRQPHPIVRTALAIACLAAFAPSASASSWPQWRGPAATGTAPAGKPPVEWSEAENVRWKVEVPGRGHASPIVWDGTVFLTSAVPAGSGAADGPVGDEAAGPARGPRSVSPDEPLDFVLLAFDLATGKELWRRTALRATPHEGTHPDGTWASASPITDGEVVCAHFGSRGLYCYDLDGKLLWSKDLGDMTTRRGFGEGSSPALHGDTLIVNWDHEGPSFIVALDKRTGEERWRRDRDEVTSWSTPVVVEVGGRPQVVVSATGKIRGYDLETGEVIWSIGGMTTNTIPSPVSDGETIYAMSGFRGNALLALRLAGASGDLEGTEAVAWSFDRDTPYVPSPVLYDGILYFLKHNQGILTAVDAADGTVLYQQRLADVQGVYASPVAADGRVYVAGRNGVTAVLGHGREFRLLAANTLDEGFDASPALAGDLLLLRGQRHLYALGATPRAEPESGR